jgi:hypothetical protein
LALRNVVAHCLHLQFLKFLILKGKPVKPPREAISLGGQHRLPEQRVHILRDQPSVRQSDSVGGMVRHKQHDGEQNQSTGGGVENTLMKNARDLVLKKLTWVGDCIRPLARLPGKSIIFPFVFIILPSRAAARLQM